MVILFVDVLFLLFSPVGVGMLFRTMRWYVRLAMRRVIDEKSSTAIILLISSDLLELGNVTVSQKSLTTSDILTVSIEMCTTSYFINCASFCLLGPLFLKL